MERVGRNEPCPCGSGKKFKKCHGMQSGRKVIAATLLSKPGGQVPSPSPQASPSEAPPSLSDRMQAISSKKDSSSS